MEEVELMKQLIPACLLAAAMAAPAMAQDSAVKSRTKIKADDASTVFMQGCLMQNTATGTFTLNHATAVKGDDLKTKSTVKTDVDKDDTTVKGKTTAKVDADDHNHGVGTTGVVGIYEVTPQGSVNLSRYVGHQVQIAAVSVDAGHGDAEVKITDDTKTKNEDAPDAKSKSRTKIDVDRGATPKLAAVSVTDVSPTCAQ
jgi:hypothetical protein